MADITIEVCDARPSYVEENVEYFVETLGRYCPWGAVLVDVVEVDGEVPTKGRRGKAPDKVGLCHATGSGMNPFVLIRVSERARKVHLAHGDSSATEAGCAIGQGNQPEPQGGRGRSGRAGGR